MSLKDIVNRLKTMIGGANKTTAKPAATAQKPQARRADVKRARQAARTTRKRG
ncbi:MAG: hypothetical protein Q4G14_11325 [Paracoccus sp. (in: a-proteobacteria)]|uniref:hypothetical protein n=1 Tax=Paracoccus sp. TaxID=267 RepID=UPI0026DFDD35|nr:hypothetical protein [Paracoccus sp. (in: a-proteobacteria)]MDO5613814.1 hypothetical protein [Paracoccus sp. (in: a-proteobacteria)]